MSQAELMEDLTAPTGVTRVPLSRLGVGSAFRSGGLCPEQVDCLVALGGAWPPILVSRDDLTVIDGAHRVAAARRMGMARLEAELFDGTPDEAFVEFVRRNVTHGLMLTMAEVGPDACVLETDAPYLAPVPHRGKRNESGYVPLIANTLATATGRSVEEIERITTDNALSLFGA